MKIYSNYQWNMQTDNSVCKVFVLQEWETECSPRAHIKMFGMWECAYNSNCRE